VKTHGPSLTTTLQALDVGCGAGVFRSQWEKFCAWTVDGVEQNEWAIHNGASAKGLLYNFDITRPPAEVLGRYDCIFLLDVLEHIEKTRAFLEGIFSCLKPEGFLVINVPAFQSLFSKYDSEAGHHRRYNEKSLRHELLSFPVTIHRVAYWGFTLIPFLLARKILSPSWKTSPDIIRKGFQPPGPVSNLFFKFLMRLENKMGGLMPRGSSLTLIAQRKR
jgi:SAM-dependent methyltransferase